MTSLLEAERLGQKSGQGFYKKEGKEILALDLQSLEYRPKQKFRMDGIGVARRYTDLRKKLHALIYNPDPACYGAAQALAKSLRNDGSSGIVYDSVRDPSGECVAIFRPRVLSPVVQGQHFCYVWDGSEISGIYIKSEYREV